MLKIRLTRVGKKNSPAFRVVVADKRKAVKREFIEILGHYNPISQPKQIVIDKERSLYWIGLGAQPSDTVNNLMCDLGILDKSKKINKVFAKKKEEPSVESPAEKKEETTAEEVAEAVTPEENQPIEPEKAAESVEVQSDEKPDEVENTEEPKE